MEKHVGLVEGLRARTHFLMRIQNHFIVDIGRSRKTRKLSPLLTDGETKAKIQSQLAETWDSRGFASSFNTDKISFHTLALQQSGDNNFIPSQ